MGFLLCQPAYNSADMGNEPQDLQDRYHLVGIRGDGSQTVFLGGMTWDTANRALAAVNEARTFTSIRIELETTERAHGAQSGFGRSG
jgi:hypothetical protein